MLSARSFLGFLAIIGCNMGSGESSRSRSAEPAPPPATFAAPIVSTTPIAVPAVPQMLGDTITADVVPLAQIAKAPASFKGRTIATTGTVRAVCQEAGCWMEIVDQENHNANVRMHAHAFFVPKTSSGKIAKVQGNVVLVKDGRECDEMAATGAHLELDATGVELL